MSRLDWFTILIVSICIIALGFLVYKTVQLMGNDQTTMPRTEISTADDRNEHRMAYEDGAGPATLDDAAADEQDLDDDELPYDPQEVEAPEKEPVTADAGSSEAPSRTAPATTPKGSTSSPSSYNSTGQYMVVAGSFSMRHNAESQVKRLKGMGYDNARVEIFNGGSLATALVDRFDNYDRAKRLVSELKVKGVDCFVKTKQ